ncbi:MAG: fibrillarin-like rRNA/tRNA 2'-O-methyltransferase [Candidatus Altiarchaeota archaeon]|nr:fibrillarin-like rRNA/tRNA 2'-O-methyltransferase [Candidatus Altiarchaeota archaeon]
MKQIFQGVYRIKGGLATVNMSPGFRVYDENLIKADGREYRSWDPFRSKLAAAILNGLREFPFRRDSSVLYLGASSGTTASHLSDICCDGTIYCLEYSKRMMRNLCVVCGAKGNMIPMLGDARYPVKYAHKMGSVDVVYQDIAQPNQAEILIKNAEEFSPGHAILSIKSRSINAVKSPKQVFREETDKLRSGFDILQSIDLRPYDKDHMLLNMKVRAQKDKKQRA